MTDTDRIIAVISSVPEKELGIITLSWELLDPDGELDYLKAASMTREVNLAVAEAHAYGRQTQQAISALQDLPARAVSS